MLMVLLGISVANAGYTEPNWTLYVLDPSSTSLGVRLHIMAYDGLTSPGDIDHRLMLNGQAHGPMFTRAQHTALISAAGSSGPCTSFETQMVSTIGAAWWSILSTAEQEDACKLYQHLAGGPNPGLIWWLEVHQQVNGDNTHRQFGQTQHWDADQLNQILDDITLNTTTNAVLSCGTPDLTPLNYSTREPEEKVAICDLLASLK